MVNFVKKEAEHFGDPKNSASLLLIGIDRSATADELRAGTSAGNGRAADLGKAYTNRYRNCFQMHSDKGKTDVNSRVCGNALNCGRGIKFIPNLGCPRAARVRMWHNADLGKIILLKALALDDKRAVEMLTALRGKVYSLFIKNRLDRREDSLSRLCGGILAYSAACNLGGRASDDEDIALLQFSLGE